MNSTLIPGPRDINQLHEIASRPTPGVIDTMKTVDSDVVVLGAGGKMGFHLSSMIQRALKLANSRFKVLAVSRFGGSAAIEQFQARGIQTLSIDLARETACESLPESRNVFYLAGVKFGTSGNPELLRQMNIEVPAGVARRYSSAATRIVALSTGCVYSFTTPESGGSVESDPTNPPGDYAVSCVGREQAFTKSGVRTSLIRLNYSVDLRYGVLVDIGQQVLQGQPVDVSTGFLNFIWQGDATAYIIRSLDLAATPPFVVNVTGQRIMAVRDIATRFGELFDKPVTFDGSQRTTAWLNNASKCHALWGACSVCENQLILWVADWLANDRPTLDKPTQFQVRDGKY